MKKLLIISLVMSLTSAATFADWNPGTAAKWVQLPDLTPNGIDVNATTPYILADDFLCVSTDLITDIHIWGSWLEDRVPTNAAGLEDPANVGFRLSIHSDIPAVIDPANGAVLEPSRPGEMLWQQAFLPGTFAVRPYATVDPGEGWYDPADQAYIWPADKTVWQYNFLIDPITAFLQKGTADAPIVYWLDVSANPAEATPGTAPYMFGWKTSVDHWNDDASWWNSSLESWNELRYPSNHPYAGQSMDLAFVITPEPASIGLLTLGALALIRRRREV
ncbi:MAG: PEP-CTERM sorting domain-containing protein [Sedimentisphaerales bacterium]|nr:PEP-CTERM sorting domain-containing protein [Sedimentisphaerales bacterium]